MAENSKKSNRTRSKQKTEESDLGIHKIPVDIVEIERNIIENWLLHSKHWIQKNRDLARKISLSVLGSFILVLLLILAHNAIAEQHNRQFYDLLANYEKSAQSPETLASLREESEKLCGNLWSTSGSQSACLLHSLLSAKNSETAKAAESLEKYTGKLGGNGLSLFFRFYTGYFYESAGNFDEALEQYKMLRKVLATIEKEDLALFHIGRIHYYQNNHEEAKKVFVSLIKDYPAGSFTAEAKKYISLLALKLPKESGGN